MAVAAASLCLWAAPSIVDRDTLEFKRDAVKSGPTGSRTLLAHAVKPRMRCFDLAFVPLNGLFTGWHCDVQTRRAVVHLAPGATGLLS